MRRLSRHLFTLCTAGSLLLCVAICVLWVKAQTSFVDGISGARMHVPVKLWGHDGGASYRLWAQPDRLGFHVLPSDYFQHTRAYLSGPQVLSGSVVLGNGYLKRTYGNGQRSLHLFVSHWLAVCVTAVLPLRVAVRASARAYSNSRAAVWRSFGLCPACGYDLRASPERCPECGTAAAVR